MGNTQSEAMAKLTSPTQTHYSSDTEYFSPREDFESSADFSEMEKQTNIKFKFPTTKEETPHTETKLQNTESQRASNSSSLSSSQQLVDFPVVSSTFEESNKSIPSETKNLHSSIPEVNNDRTKLKGKRVLKIEGRNQDEQHYQRIRHNSDSMAINISEDNKGIESHKENQKQFASAEVLLMESETPTDRSNFLKTSSRTYTIQPKNRYAGSMPTPRKTPSLQGIASNKELGSLASFIHKKFFSAFHVGLAKFSGKKPAATDIGCSPDLRTPDNEENNLLQADHMQKMEIPKIIITDSSFRESPTPSPKKLETSKTTPTKLPKIVALHEKTEEIREESEEARIQIEEFQLVEQEEPRRSSRRSIIQTWMSNVKRQQRLMVYFIVMIVGIIFIITAICVALAY